MSRGRAAALALATLVVAVVAVPVGRSLHRAAPPSPARLAALRSERDELEKRLGERLAAAGEQSLATAPRGGLMIGIPTSLTATLLEQTVTGLFGETRLVLDGVEARAHGVVRTKVLFANRTVGAYTLDVHIRRLQGLVRPAAPTIRFGDGRVSALVPVRLAGAEGEADLRVRWYSKGPIASLLCGDLDVTRRIAGSVLSREYRLEGDFTFEATGDAIVLRPRELTRRIRLSVAPSAAAWASLDGAIESQPKGCEIALRKAEVPAKLAALLARGIEVKLPRSLLAPITIPIGAVPSIEVEGVTFALKVTPRGVLVARDRLWYAADIAVSQAPR